MVIMKTVLNVKIDRDIKIKAQKTAAKLGIPLSFVVTQILRNFIYEQEILVFDSSKKRK